MLKKLVLAATLMAATLAPVAPAAAEDEACMLRNGCFLTSGGDASPPYWVCPLPPEYMDCVS